VILKKHEFVLKLTSRRFYFFVKNQIKVTLYNNSTHIRLRTCQKRRQAYWNEISV